MHSQVSLDFKFYRSKCPRKQVQKYETHSDGKTQPDDKRLINNKFSNAFKFYFFSLIYLQYAEDVQKAESSDY